MHAHDAAIALAASALVTYLVHSTLILGAVWAGVVLARPGARTRDVAWKCALCVPLATTLTHVVWPERALARRYTVELPGLAEVAQAAASERLSTQGSPQERDGLDRGVTAETGITRGSARPPQHLGRRAARASAVADARPSFTTLGGLALLAIASIACCVLLVPHLRLAWHLRRRTPITDGLLAIELASLLPLARAERGAPLRAFLSAFRSAPPSVFLSIFRSAPPSVRLSVSDALSSPIAMGVLRPEIVVPRRALTELSRPLARALVAHELAHHARRDPLWTWVAHTLTTLFAVQPLNRVARRELVATAELLADDLAVQWTNDGVGLAHCLAEVASWVGPRDRELAALAMVRTRDSRGLRRRIERALERPAEGHARCLGPLALVVAGAVAFGAPGLALVARGPRSAAPEAWPHPLGASRAVTAPRAATAPRALEAVERQLADACSELELLGLARDPDVRAAAAELAIRAERLAGVAADLRAAVADQPNTLDVDDAGADLPFLGGTR